MRIKNRQGRRFLLRGLLLVVGVAALATWLIYSRTVGLDRACRKGVEKLAGRSTTVAAPAWETGQFWEMAVVHKDQSGVRRFTNRIFVLGVRNVRGREAYALGSLVFGEDGCPVQGEVALVSTSEFVMFRPALDGESAILIEAVLWDFPLSVGKAFTIGRLAERRLMARVQRSAVVETPAGQFETFQILREGNPDMLYWYAPKVRADVRFETPDGRIQAVLRDHGFVRPERGVEYMYGALAFAVRSQNRTLRYLAVPPLEALASYDIERPRAEHLLKVLEGDKDTTIRERARRAAERLSQR